MLYGVRKTNYITIGYGVCYKLCGFVLFSLYFFPRQLYIFVHMYIN